MPYSSGTTPLRTDTVRVLEEKILRAINAGGGGGGYVQVVAYTGDRPTVPPPNNNAPALGVQPAHPIFVWDYQNQVWS